jgi:molybdate transport repressor ModE-like protein
VTIHLDLRWHFGESPAEEVEPDLFQLLQAIQEFGSLQLAAKKGEISYRHAWGLMQKWERLIGHPLATLERGKGARLTPLGEKFLWGQRRVLARLGPELESLASELDAELRLLLSRGTPAPLRITASHGLAIVMLRDLLHKTSVVKLDLQFRGSLDSLRTLAGSKCDLAGFHLPEGPLGRRVAPQYRRWLDPEDHVLIHVVRRCQGLMTQPDNPKGITTLTDLIKPGVRFVNRQAGSGTRLLLDCLLEEARMDPERITGYHTEEFTHMAVAALVAGGAADAGFGIQAAASQFQLRFVPVVWENYLLAVKRAELSSPGVFELLRILRGAEFRDQVNALPGYDAEQSGTAVPVSQVLL